MNTRWQPFPWFLLRATGFALKEAEGCVASDDLVRPWPERVERGRRSLWSRARRPRFREALLVSSPEVEALLDTWFGHVDEGRRNGMDRKRERVLLRFLGRFTAKNDSTSFFGAVAAGRFDRVQPLDTVLPTDVRRRVYVTQWVAQALLGRAIAELGDGEQPLVRAAGVTADGHHARRWAPARRGFEVVAETTVPEALTLLDAVDGAKTPGQLADALGWPRAQVDPLIADLRGLGILEAADALPVGLVDPLAACEVRVARALTGPARSRWLDRLGRVRDLAAAFEGTTDTSSRRDTLQALEEDVAQWLDAPARRRGGEFYASRGCLHEQAERTEEPVGLPASWPESLARALTPYAELCLLPIAAERLKLHGWLRGHLKDNRESVPWREVLDALGRDLVGYEGGAPPEACALTDTWRRARERLRARIDAHVSDSGVATPLVLAPEELEDLLGPVRPLLDQIGTPFANPDLMVATGSDALEMILAEAHHLPMLTGCLIPSLGDEASVRADTLAHLTALCGEDTPALVSSFQHSFISVSPDVGEIALEISGRAARPMARRAPFAALRVRWDGSRARFSVRTLDGEVRAVTPLTRVARLQHASPVFALTMPTMVSLIAAGDWDQRRDLPRITYGGLTVQRRTWWLESDAWCDRASPADSADGLAEVLGEARPRFVFVRSEEEAKPVLIDTWHAPSLELLWWMARRQPVLRISEMLPGPGSLWLQGPQGPHTSELRTVWTRTKRPG